MTVTEGEWKEWATHPVTRAFLEDLKETHQDTLEAWGNGAYVGDSGEETLQFSAKALGSLDMLKQIIKRIDDLREAKNDE